MSVQPHKRQHPPTPIGKLLNRYGISLQKLADCLVAERVEFNSRSTLHRMVHGEISDEMRERLYPATARCLSKFLINRGLNKSEIDDHLTAIFTEGEYSPMISKRIALTDAEVKFFGLSIDPFKRDPESRDEVFMSPQLREIVDTVMDAIKYRHFVAILGPIGSGKTTLRNLIEDAIAADTDIKVVWPEFFDQGKVTPLEIARTILISCGVRPPGRTVALGTAVKSKLESMTRNGKRIALGFDECHKLNKDSVRSLKNFLEMSSGGFQKYLGIFLLGWPDFEDTLELPDFQEIYERINVINMPDFADYARGYFAHRLALAGIADISSLFDEEAVELICSQAETPLGLGNIANEALRISLVEFENKKVIGASIKTKMFFETKAPQGFRKR